MTKIKKIGLLLSLSFILAGSTLAADVNFVPQIGIPGTEFKEGSGVPVGEVSEETTRSTLLARYVKAIYTYGLSIVGVLAVLMLMAGGFTWLTSAGNNSKVEQAKKMIEGSLFGAFLLLGASFFLNTINPDLAKLPVIEMSTVNRVNQGCCEVAKDDGTTKITSNENCKSGFSKTKFLDGDGKCTEPVCCVIASQKQDKSYCMTTTESNCKKHPTGLAKKGSCESLNECQGANDSMMSCDGVSNGKAPLRSSGYNEIYCYNGIIYSGDGNLGEPCGNEAFSKCTENYFDCNQDQNGRDCTSFVWCCKYNANGTKKE